MSDRKITHEVKLQKSVIIILGVLAVGVMANAFAPAFNVKDALAGLTSDGTRYDPIYISCQGCN